MSDWQRLVRYIRKPAQRPKHERQLYGEKTETGQFYRCWVCGATNNRDKQIVVTAQTPGTETKDSGVAIENFTDPAVPVFMGSDFLSIMLAPSGGSVVRAVDGFGVPIVIDAGLRPATKSGCWFCGSQNYR